MDYGSVLKSQFERSKSVALGAELARLAGSYEDARKAMHIANAHLELANRAASGLNGGQPTCAIGNLARCEFKFVSWGEAHFTAYASVFRKYPDDAGDCVNDYIQPGAYEDDLKERGNERPMYFQHDPTTVIGTARKIREDAKGLKFHGWLDLRSSLGQEIRDALQSKVLSELSIGYKALDFDRPTKDARIIKRIRLDEISVVTSACDWLATVISSTD
ncbi:MAG: HK97 family phage prohead protease [Bryobacteraceae bacterium]